MTVTFMAEFENVAAAGYGGVKMAAGGRSASLAELLEEGRLIAAALVTDGVRPGDRVGIVAESNLEFLTTLFGVIYAGGAAVPLAPVAALGGIQRYLEHVRRVAADAGIRRIAGTRRALQVLNRLGAVGSDGARVELVQAETLSRARPGLEIQVPHDSTAVIQYTSGSTSVPRGVVLTHRNITAGLAAIQEGVNMSPADVIGIWIPLFHDMGLFSLLSGLGKGCRVVIWSPSSFVRRPGAWLHEMASEGCSMSAAPNFCFDYLATEAEDAREGLDLSRWRVACNGAEPVNAGTIHRFSETFGECGFPPEAMLPVYGMAEATLAVTFPNPGSTPKVICVNRERLQLAAAVEEMPANSSAGRPLVSLGRPVKGISVRIGGAGSNGAVGEVEITGLPVTPGYYGRPENELLTEDGWRRTEDLGFVLDGELYITGRMKDVIKLHGVSYFAEDAEAIVRDLPGVYRGHCAAVRLDSDRGESMAVVVETSTETAGERIDLTNLIKSEVSLGLGLPNIAVHLAEPRMLPVTSSGKIQRARIRAALATGEIA